MHGFTCTLSLQANPLCCVIDACLAIGVLCSSVYCTWQQRITGTMYSCLLSAHIRLLCFGAVRHPFSRRSVIKAAMLPTLCHLFPGVSSVFCLLVVPGVTLLRCLQLLPATLLCDECHDASASTFVTQKEKEMCTL